MNTATLDVLAVGPHPDDVELFAGGTVAHVVQLGYRVGLLDLTRGELATRGSAEIRAHEAAAAAQVLGVTRDQLDLPDGGLRADDQRQIQALVAYLRLHRPELVLCPWGNERHPDHESAAALVQRAVFFAGVGGHITHGLERHLVREVLHYPMRVLDAPSFVVDITHVAELKRRAILCHASQVTPAPGAPPTLVGSAQSLDALEARDRFYGAQIGAAHGEPFIVRSTLHLTDPLAHLRGRPGSAFFFEPR